jgi:hypothetical protein
MFWIILSLLKSFKTNRYFKRNVSFDDSIVKISDEIPRNDPATINTVVYTKGLDKIFRENMKIV